MSIFFPWDHNSEILTHVPKKKLLWGDCPTLGVNIIANGRTLIHVFEWTDALESLVRKQGELHQEMCGNKETTGPMGRAVSKSTTISSWHMQAKELEKRPPCKGDLSNVLLPEFSSKAAYDGFEICRSSLKSDGQSATKKRQRKSESTCQLLRMLLFCFPEQKWSKHFFSTKSPRQSWLLMDTTSRSKE